MDEEYYAQLDRDIAQARDADSSFKHMAVLMSETVKTITKLPNIALFAIVRSVFATKRGAEDTVKFLYNAVTKHKKLEDLDSPNNEIENHLEIPKHIQPKLYKMRQSMLEAKSTLSKVHKEFADNPDPYGPFLRCFSNFHVHAKEYYKERGKYLKDPDQIKINDKLLKAVDHHTEKLTKEYKRAQTNEKIHSVTRHPRKLKKPEEISYEIQ